MSTQSATQTTARADVLHDALRQELLRLARQEDDAASREAARVHYWEPTPVAVVVHRQCAPCATPLMSSFRILVRTQRSADLAAAVE
jgi:hypothetical protein